MVYYNQLFAAALLPKSKPNKVSRVSLSNRSISSSILSAHTDWRSQWETLDCIDLHNAIPHRWHSGTWFSWSMSDDDLKNVLVVIDAKNNLKTLKLTNCRISGYGLKPLKKSTVLERIDLSMAEPHTKPVRHSTAMNLNTILPILYSIVNKNGNSLKHIQLPLRWRMEKQPALKEFMECYNLHLINDANLTCSMTRVSDQEDTVICGNEVEGARLKRGEKQFGIQSSTCYNCLAFACSDHKECKKSIDYCGICQKNYCGDCTQIWKCHKCRKSCCNKCEERDSTCYTCGRVTCRACEFKRCYSCLQQLCMYCDVRHNGQWQKLCGRCSYATSDSDSDY